MWKLWRNILFNVLSKPQRYNVHTVPFDVLKLTRVLNEFNSQRGNQTWPDWIWSLHIRLVSHCVWVDTLFPQWTSYKLVPVAECARTWTNYRLGQCCTWLHIAFMCIFFFKRHQDSASLVIKFFFPPILAENIPSFNLQLRRSTSAGRRCGPRCTQDCSCKSALPAPPPGTGTGACSSWLRGDKARQVLIRPAGGATSYWMRETHQDASSVPSSTKKAAV